MNLTDYYQNYWQKRKKRVGSPIAGIVPKFLHRYTQYGAIVGQIPKGSRILDLGCGDGNVSQLYLSKGKVTGLDISQTALNMAKKKGLSTLLHDLNKLPLPFSNNSFDVIILTDVLEHVIDPLNLLIEINRIIISNGLLIITVPNFARLENRFRMLMGDPTDILHWDKYGDEVEHLHWFTKGKLEYLLFKSGFKNIKFVPTGLPFWFIFGQVGMAGLSKMLTVAAEK